MSEFPLMCLGESQADCSLHLVYEPALVDVLSRLMEGLVTGFGVSIVLMLLVWGIRKALSLLE